jgi:signal transduction histidine kinase
VLARHFELSFLSELDGYTLRTIPMPEGRRTRVYQSPGGQLWMVVPQGLAEYRDTGWSTYQVPEIARSHPPSPLRLTDPVPLYPVRHGLVLCLLPDRLLEFSASGQDGARTATLRAADQTQIGLYQGFTPSRDGGLWISGERGLAKVPGPLRMLRTEAEWRQYVIPDSLQVTNLQSPREDDQGGVTVIGDCETNEHKAIVHFDGQTWNLQASAMRKVRQAWRGPGGIGWATSIDGLFQWETDNGEVTQNDEISPRQFWDSAMETGGNFWLATSDGLFRYSPPLWRTPTGLKKILTSVNCLTADGDGRLWFIAGGRLQTFFGDSLKDYPLPQSLSGSLQARALFWLRRGTLILAAAGPEDTTRDELFRWQADRGVFQALSPEEIPPGSKALGLLRDGTLCVRLPQPGASSGAGSWVVFDGQRSEPFADPPPRSMIGDGHCTLFTAQNGDLWVSGPAATACYHEGRWTAFTSSDKSSPEGATCFAELPDGRIWCAAQDQLWEYDGQSWSLFQRGFEGINDLVRTREGSVWVAGNSGIQRYVRGVWLENGIEEGLASMGVRDLYEDAQGRFWAGTTRGLTRFHPEADQDPPKTSIENPGETAYDFPEGSTINLSFSAVDRWKYTPRDRLVYSFRLDGGEWSEFKDATHEAYSDLPAGQHHFEVVAMDRNGNKDPRPAQVEFAVVLPWYRETRLVLISSAGAALVLFFAGLAFNRHLQLKRSYAAVEQKVAERTQQLETANRELVQIQKMKALGTLAAGIAHDFNNILSIIKGSAQIIEDNLDNPEKIRVRTERIRTVVEQGAGIVKAMLGFSRDSGQEPRQCDLNEVVNETLKLLGDRFLREVQIVFQPGPGLPPLVTSKDLIQQILLNLIFNAAESMEKQREIRVTTGALEQVPAQFVLAPRSSSAYLAVSVQDFGCGIPPENLTRIFEPFFTTKALSSRRGTGLGLSMAYELAKKLGAGLAVVSAVGEGSTFTLILPVTEASVAAEAQASPTHDRQSVRAGTEISDTAK